MSIDPSGLQRTRMISGAAGLLALIIGAIGLIGWVIDNHWMKTGLTGQLTMKANAAVALCATGASVLALLPDQRGSRLTLLGRGLGLGVALLGFATLTQHLLGWNLGLDELLFSEPHGALATTSPGRMGPPACISFVLLGSGCWFFDRKTKRGRALAQWLAAAAWPTPFLAILGYATGAAQLYGVARYTGIALHTAVALVLLAIALFLARAEHEPAAILVADNPGGEVARTMLPAAVLVPLVLGWLRTLGQQQGLYDTQFGRALLLLSLIGLLIVIVWRLARRLSTVADERALAQRVSEGARAEADRFARENRATLSMLESLLAHAPIGLVFFDHNRRCFRFNEELLRAAGPDRSPIVGQKLEDVLPGRCNGLESAVVAVFEHGHSTMNLEMVSNSGAAAGRSWLTGIFPVRDAQGEVALAGAVLVEITERRALEEQKAALLERERSARLEAERAATLKDEFLATLSHELRTPLNAVLGWTTIARRTPGCPTTLERPLEVIERNARAQAQLIEDLLDISRIVSGKMRLAASAVQLSSVVNAALMAVAPAAEAKQIQIHVDVPEQLPTIVADAARIQQVVWNLLSNAVKFTRKGGHVSVRVQRTGEGLELSVQDDGVGIAPDFLPHVFDRFRQADASSTRRHGGLGLGLAIVKQLVELHGGSVAAESAGADQGSRFVVNLPIAPEMTASVRHPSSDPVTDDVLRGLRVLVVDDDADAREFVATALSHQNAEVAVASNVDEALTVLAREVVDVLVSDIGMPGKDGYDLIREVRAQGRSVPALAVTAFARAEDRERVLRAGFQMHLPKPLDTEELALAIATLAGRLEPAAAK